MSAQIRYAYRKEKTWLYRRNYPSDVAAVLGVQALKQSLKTQDQSTARVRAAEINAHYEQQVSRVRSEAQEVLLQQPAWAEPSTDVVVRLRSALEQSGATSRPAGYQVNREVPTVTVAAASRAYLLHRQSQLRPGGFKSVRYSVELFASRHGQRAVTSLTREDGRGFLQSIAQLSPHAGRSPATQNKSLDWLVDWSEESRAKLTGRTQRRIWSQVNHWLDWCVYEGQLSTNPFKTIRFEAKVRPNPYEVPTNEEVRDLLAARNPALHTLMLICLLSGMRAGEAAGLLAEDVVTKGSDGLFFHVRPNELRLLKTDAAERWVPVHPELLGPMKKLPKEGPLFPRLTVNDVTKRFTVLRDRLGFNRPGLVFHSTRKWFVTQCERTGVPEHWTATLVGHQSARSENGLTYGIYSAGISDHQKRSIVDQIRLPS